MSDHQTTKLLPPSQPDHCTDVVSMAGFCSVLVTPGEAHEPSAMDLRSTTTSRPSLKPYRGYYSLDEYNLFATFDAEPLDIDPELRLPLRGPTSCERASSPTTPSISSLSLPFSSVQNVLLCQHPGCRSTFKGKYQRGTLQRHVRMKHGKHGEEGMLYPCEIDRCKNTFCRQDSRLKHYRKHHPELSLPSPISRSCFE